MSEQIQTARKPNVLWGFTGSVATVKVPKAVLELRKKGYQVALIGTEKGKSLLLDGIGERYDPITFQKFENTVKIYVDSDEWTKEFTVGKDEVLHIELRKWADILVIAPLSANTLAKIANGICDNLLTCVVRAWDPRKPIVVAPAMNTFMWNSPFTEKHLNSLKTLQCITVVPPIVKTLACKDTGIGAMAEIEEIQRVLELYSASIPKRNNSNIKIIVLCITFTVIALKRSLLV